MSDREFENYLQLLRGLLRLSRDQSESISAELRSHMEDRLEELLARGIPREEAIRQALSEFGDAAGLGNKFGAISLSRKRRWLMRLMTFSTAATLLIAASLITFWPGRNAAPGVAGAVAQTSKTDPFTPPKRISDQQEKPITSANDRIEAALTKTTTIDVVDMPLKDVCMFLQETHDIPIFIKKSKLAEASVSLDKPITISLRGVPFRTVLDLVLQELELSYDIRDVLIITTPEDAESQLQTRVYDCRDLLAMVAPEVPTPRTVPSAPAGTTIPQQAPGGEGGVASPAEVPSNAGSKGRGGMGGGMGIGGGVGAGGGIGIGVGGAGMGGMIGVSRTQQPQTELEKRTSDLIEIITSTVRPDSWDDVGGPGAIDAYNGLFVVSQTTQVHRDVEHVLDMLRQAAGLEVPKTGKVVR